MGRRFGVRAILQIVLTGMTLVTACLAFVWAFYFEQFMDEMLKNYKGEPATTFLPCLRSTLDACENSVQDECYTYCCPRGYFCARSPIVGLYCQDGSNECKTFNWCRDFADIPGTCPTVVCKTHQTVLRVTAWSFILAAIGIVLDLVLQLGRHVISWLCRWSVLAVLHSAKCERHPIPLPCAALCVLWRQASGRSLC
mmetsp:Transcript_47770/g.127902  ORF Transcript_47770/g.127902 Transcript_47770/m.127902 type:complete len:197 (-) Transcript_47770:162-752(-)